MSYESLKLGKYTLSDDGFLSSTEWTEPKQTQLRWNGSDFEVVPGNWVDPEVTVVLLNEVIAKTRSLQWVEQELLNSEDMSVFNMVEQMYSMLGAQKFDSNSHKSIFDDICMTDEDNIRAQIKIASDKADSAAEDAETILSQVQASGPIQSGIDEISGNLDLYKEQLKQLGDDIQEIVEGIKDTLTIAEDPNALNGQFAECILAKCNELGSKFQIADGDDSVNGEFTSYLYTKFETLNSCLTDLLNKIKGTVEAIDKNAVSIKNNCSIDSENSDARKTFDKIQALDSKFNITAGLGEFTKWLDDRLDALSLPSTTLGSIGEATLKACQGNVLTPSNYVDMERALKGIAVTLSDQGKQQVVEWMQQNLASSYAKWVEIASMYSNQELEFANANSALGSQLASLSKILADVAGINQSLSSLGGWTGSIEQVSNRLASTRDALIETSGSFCSLLNSTVNEHLSAINTNVNEAIDHFTETMKKDRDDYYKAQLAIASKELEIKNSELKLAVNKFEQETKDNKENRDLKAEEIQMWRNASKGDLIARGVEAIQKQYNESKAHDLEVAKFNKPSL